MMINKLCTSKPALMLLGSVPWHCLASVSAAIDMHVSFHSPVRFCNIITIARPHQQRLYKQNLEYKT